MPFTLNLGGQGLDLSSRLFTTAVVVGSPAAAAETIIASVTITEDVALTKGVVLVGYCAFTAGTNGVGANLKLHRTDASGTTVKASGLVTVAATNLYDRAISAVDTGVTPLNQVYVMTLTIASGSAPSTVSAVTLTALVI